MTPADPSVLIDIHRRTGLKPCPFCGCRSAVGTGRMDGYYTIPHTAGCALNAFLYAENARAEGVTVEREAWNHRPIEDALREEMEQERRAISKAASRFVKRMEKAHSLDAEVRHLKAVIRDLKAGVTKKLRREVERDDYWERMERERESWFFEVGP